MRHKPTHHGRSHEKTLTFEVGIALSVVALGAILIYWRPIPVVAAVVLAALFAVFHGYPHGTEMPLEASKAGDVTGFVLATG